METSPQPPLQVQAQPAAYGGLCDLSPPLGACNDGTSDV
eukprot:CAMPEP_0185782280 /NCGR_PEP_ID=MMETSP1174-20130828/107750_1 /TAXON_ID=35687 /ORGANISM="Dictyocha speculum, Strain CCMP1381" /LENGTH=38 /DNA_ID= /DNA_START= /DNA_END= /DNA_ORIENTATION=